MKKFVSVVMAVTLGAMMLAGCGAASSTPATTAAAAASGDAAAADDSGDDYADVEVEVQMNMSNQMAADHSINMTCLEFARLVKEKSGGTMVVDVFPSATLGTETENLQALGNGTLDLGIIALEFYANYIQEAGITCLPFMYDSLDDCYEKLHGEAGELIKEQILEQTDVRILDYYVLDFRQVFTVDRELHDLSDFAGLIIRIPDSTTYEQAFRQLGAAPTAMALGETYTALDTGVVAAVENTPETIITNSYYEVCKYVNETNHIIGPTSISMSNKVFESLTEEQQNIMLEAAKEACDYGLQITKDGSEQNFADLMDEGMTLIETDVDSLKAAIDYNAFECAKTDMGQQILSAFGK